MKEHENLYEKIQEILGGEQGSFKVLEQQINMDLQFEYYESSKLLSQELGEKWAFDNAGHLLEPGYSVELKKDILARLATIEKVECYRYIEDYLQGAEKEIHDWAVLALNESRMLLESSLLDESQVFISTGLGGKDEKLRYFVALVSRSKLDFDKTQKKVITNEFDYILKKYDAEIEQLGFSAYMATLVLLIPMHHSLKYIFQEAIGECNKYGDFLNDDFIVTNVKTLTFQEIKNFLERNNDRV